MFGNKKKGKKNRTQFFEHTHTKDVNEIMTQGKWLMKSLTEKCLSFIHFFVAIG